MQGATLRLAQTGQKARRCYRSRQGGAAGGVL